MKLLTKAILNKLPKLYSQEKVEDPVCQVKFFDPTGSFTWYGIEFDGEDMFFGFVTSNLCPEGELGYFSLSELKTCKQGKRGLTALPIERDMYWESRKLSEVREDIKY